MANNNNKENNIGKLGINHAPQRNSKFLDDENIKSSSKRLSIAKLQLKREELIRKCKETDYYKSGKDKRNTPPKD